MNTRQPFLAGGAGVAVVLVGVLVALGVYAATGAIKVATAPDTQCTRAHVPASAPPAPVVTAADYLALGDYEYDRGDCASAIAAYTRAIELDPGNAAAYNNRAYTHMRLRAYDRALPDLDRAIALRPDYVNALMNRGDLYNYYLPNQHGQFDRQRAIADYDRVVALGATQGTSVCGHRLLAIHNGWNPGTVFSLLTRGVDAGC